MPVRFDAVSRHGRHARRPSTLQRVAPAVATVVVLGFGAWAGTALFDSPPAGDPGPVGAVGIGTGDGQPGGGPPAGVQTGASDPAAVAATPPAPTQAAVDAGLTAFEAEVVDIVNARRAASGCGAISVDPRLTAAARAHSTDMATRGYFDHTSPDGVEFATRITQAGYRWSMAAENIAMGQSSPAEVMDAWMNSEGHRSNILNCRLVHLGVGLAYDGRDRPYWTQEFATPV
jgi:uncharacterized protein YkwD